MPVVEQLASALELALAIGSVTAARLDEVTESWGGNAKL